MQNVYKSAVLCESQEEKRKKMNKTKAQGCSLSLMRLGDYLGKAYSKDMVENHGLSKILKQWLKSNPNLKLYGENGFLNFIRFFLGGIFRGIFENTDSQIDIQIKTSYMKNKMIKLSYETRKKSAP